MEKHTEQAAYTGSIIAGVAGGLSWGEIGSICGILFGLFTILMNMYYKHKEDRRAEIALQYQINLKKKGEKENE